MPGNQYFNSSRARSYLSRLPLFTRALIVVIAALWLATLQSAFDLKQWGSLIPDEINIFTSE